jgi:hypothetical protein
MINRWFPLAYVLSNLNRRTGLHDAYPFALLPRVIDKLRFIHDVIWEPEAFAADRPEPPAPCSLPVEARSAG